MVSEPAHHTPLGTAMFSHIAPAFLEEILLFLAPTFITGANGSIDAARHAALASLAAYDAQTEQEIRLAAQITMSGFIILETLAQSMNQDLPCNTVLRLRGNANATQRALNQCQRALDRLQKARRQSQPVQSQPGQTQPVQPPPDPAAIAEPTAHPPAAATPVPAAPARPASAPPRASVHAASSPEPVAQHPKTLSAHPGNSSGRPPLRPAA